MAGELTPRDLRLDCVLLSSDVATIFPSPVRVTHVPSQPDGSNIPAPTDTTGEDSPGLSNDFHFINNYFRQGHGVRDQSEDHQGKV